MTPTSRPGSPRRRSPAPTAPKISEFVRWSRVDTARARIVARWYDRDEVKSRLVDALLEELRRR